MRNLRQVPVRTLTIGMLVLATACGSQEVERGRRSRPPETVTTLAPGKGKAATGEPRSTTTAPLLAALQFAQTVRKLWPPVTTTIPTNTYRLAPPLRADSPVPTADIPTGVEEEPRPVSSRRCVGAIESEIESVFGAAAPWFASVVVRESGCDPAARNSEGASGLAQLMLPLHGDLFRVVGCDPDTQWSDISCNLRAAFKLYQGAGVSPWRL